MPLAGKPISAYRRIPPPLPPRWHPSAIQRPPLSHFFLLSMLLHALAILLFGAPSGGSREGRALWGSLQVVLQAAPPAAPAPTLKMDSSLKLDRPRSAPAPRSRSKAAAAKLEPRVAPAVPSTDLPRYEPPPTETPFSMPPLLDRILKPDRNLDLPPPLQLPPPTEVQTVRPTEVPPVRPAAPVKPAPVRPAYTPPPAPAPAIEEAPAPRPVERILAEPLPLAAPLVQPPPLPVPLPMPERLATPPPIERAPIEAPAVPAIPSTPPVERPPVEVPAIPVPSLETVAPTPSAPAPRVIERTPAQEIPVAPQAPPAPQRARPPVQEREVPARIEPVTPAIVEPALRTAPFRATLPSDQGTRPRDDTPSSSYDPTAAPTVDLDAVRKRAAAIAREGTGRRAVLPFPMPPVPEKKTKEQIAIEKALKPDCRTAYQGLGLAAIVPLIANEFGEGNCRW